MTTKVWARVGVDTMSRRMFYLVMCTVVTYGFVASGVMASYTESWQPSLWSFLAVAALPFLGILLSSTNSALLSFVGFNLVAIPFGALLGPVLTHYEVNQPGVVAETAYLTAMVTVAMGLSGVMYPDFYRRIGGFLFGALVALLVVMVLQLFIPGLGEFKLINYAAAALFALYIGFDMRRASEVPATLDNAIDVAVSLYLDVLNLFLHLLRIKS